MLGWVIFLAFVTFTGVAVLIFWRDREREKRRNEMSTMLGVRPKVPVQPDQPIQPAKTTDPVGAPDQTPAPRLVHTPDIPPVAEPASTPASAPVAEHWRPPAEREKPILFKLLEMEARAAPAVVETKVDRAVRDDTAAILSRVQHLLDKPRSEGVKRYEREYADPHNTHQGRPCTLRIGYVDADGVCTTRLIAPYKSGNTNLKFDAWCESRQARRTFFFERIQSAVNVVTGTHMNRADVFRHIHPGRRVPRDLL